MVHTAVDTISNRMSPKIVPNRLDGSPTIKRQQTNIIIVAKYVYSITTYGTGHMQCCTHKQILSEHSCYHQRAHASSV